MSRPRRSSGCRFRRKRPRRRAFDDISALARGLARQSDLEAFARLNACVASLYQLSAAEFEHVLGTFPLVERDVRDACLGAFHRRL